MTVWITGRARTAISEHTAASGPIIACGLLIGRSDRDGISVERSLRCFNVAPPAVRMDGFEIDPHVHVNVRRSLAATGSSVIGFYYGTAAAAEPAERDLEHLRLWPDTVLLIHGPPESPEPILRAWTRPADGSGIREMSMEFVATRSASLLICPE
ncbi:MAG: hypothetical protein WD766_07610 [Gemmatimonadota bacterium]